jgi:hypothetical protein
MSRRLLAALAAVTLIGAAPPAFSASPPASWDGLTHVQSRRFDAVYLLPGADFSGYTKIMLDPTEVAFRKNWLRDFNASSMTLDQRISNTEAQRILDNARTGFEEVFQRAFTDAGVQLVTQPGPDVLRLRTGVANLTVSAPDRMTAGRSATFSRDAGSATVVIEARDSVTGALLGRAVDSRTLDDNMMLRRNSVTNRSDFERLFRQWANISVEGLKELKAMPPIPEPAAASSP